MSGGEAPPGVGAICRASIRLACSLPTSKDSYTVQRLSSAAERSACADSHGLLVELPYCTTHLDAGFSRSWVRAELAVQQACGPLLIASMGVD
jgi:hypothetical protein